MMDHAGLVAYRSLDPAKLPHANKGRIQALVTKLLNYKPKSKLQEQALPASSSEEMEERRDEREEEKHEEDGCSGGDSSGAWKGAHGKIGTDEFSSSFTGRETSEYEEVDEIKEEMESSEEEEVEEGEEI